MAIPGEIVEVFHGLGDWLYLKNEFVRITDISNTIRKKIFESNI